MTQTYADRVAARPGYATLKNRKKELRRQSANASTDADLERLDKLWLDAEDRYRHSPASQTSARLEWYRRRDAARVWARDHAAAAASCGDETCPAATGKKCICRCGGVNHGAAA